jgi:serine O-acetyltransferase
MNGPNWKLVRDLYETTRVATGTVDTKNMVRVFLTSDSFRVVSLFRVRQLARRAHLGAMNRFLRLYQMAVYGVEIGKDVTLGEGVYFVHTLGTIVGGNAIIGDRVRFMGNNTVGTARDDGYPHIGNDVIIGCGARILGNISVGDGAVIGANAVVLEDVPAGATVVGVPARVVSTAGETGGHAKSVRRKVGTS